jgi:hypothetical protein
VIAQCEPPPTPNAPTSCHPHLFRRPQYNVFGITFQQVLQEEADVIQWDADRDGFDNAIVWVQRDSVPTFMTELKIRLGQQAREADAAARTAADAAAAEPGAGDQRGSGARRGARGGGGGSPAPAASKQRGGSRLEEELADAEGALDQ